MNSDQIAAADDWAHDFMQDRQQVHRSRRISFTLTDLVLAFEAGVSWERGRGLLEIRKRTRALNDDARTNSKGVNSGTKDAGSIRGRSRRQRGGRHS